MVFDPNKDLEELEESLDSKKDISSYIEYQRLKHRKSKLQNDLDQLRMMQSRFPGHKPYENDINRIHRQLNEAKERVQVFEKSHTQKELSSFYTKMEKRADEFVKLQKTKPETYFRAQEVAKQHNEYEVQQRLQNIREQKSLSHKMYRETIQDDLGNLNKPVPQAQAHIEGMFQKRAISSVLKESSIPGNQIKQILSKIQQPDFSLPGELQSLGYDLDESSQKYYQSIQNQLGSKKVGPLVESIATGQDPDKIKNLVSKAIPDMKPKEQEKFINKIRGAWQEAPKRKSILENEASNLESLLGEEAVYSMASKLYTGGASFEQKMKNYRTFKQSLPYKEREKELGDKYLDLSEMHQDPEIQSKILTRNESFGKIKNIMGDVEGKIEKAKTPGMSEGDLSNLTKEIASLINTISDLELTYKDNTKELKQTLDIKQKETRLQEQSARKEEQARKKEEALQKQMVAAADQAKRADTNAMIRGYHEGGSVLSGGADVVGAIVNYSRMEQVARAESNLSGLDTKKQMEFSQKLAAQQQATQRAQFYARAGNQVISGVMSGDIHSMDVGLHGYSAGVISRSKEDIEKEKAAKRSIGYERLKRLGNVLPEDADKLKPEDRKDYDTIQQKVNEYRDSIKGLSSKEIEPIHKAKNDELIKIFEDKEAAKVTDKIDVPRLYGRNYQNLMSYENIENRTKDVTQAEMFVTGEQVDMFKRMSGMGVDIATMGRAGLGGAGSQGIGLGGVIAGLGGTINSFGKANALDKYQIPIKRAQNEYLAKENAIDLNIPGNDMAQQWRSTLLEQYEAQHSIPNRLAQLNRDAAESNYQSLLGAGSAAGGLFRGSMNEGAMKGYAAMGLDTKEATALMGQAYRSMGGNVKGQGVNSILKDATWSRQTGMMGESEYLGLAGRISDVGGKSSDLKKTMQEAVTLGIDNAKNINEIVSISTSMANVSLSQTGFSNYKETQESLNSLIKSYQNAGRSNNEAVKLSEISYKNYLDMTKDKSANLGNMMNMLNISGSLRGTLSDNEQLISSTSEAMYGLQPSEQKALRTALESGDYDEFRKQASRSGLSLFAGAKDEQIKAWNEKGGGKFLTPVGIYSGQNVETRSMYANSDNQFLKQFAEVGGQGKEADIKKLMGNINTAAMGGDEKARTAVSELAKRFPNYFINNDKGKVNQLEFNDFGQNIAGSAVGGFASGEEGVREAAALARNRMQLADSVGTSNYEKTRKKIQGQYAEAMKNPGAMAGMAGGQIAGDLMDAAMADAMINAASKLEGSSSSLSASSRELLAAAEALKNLPSNIEQALSRVVGAKSVSDLSADPGINKNPSPSGQAAGNRNPEISKQAQLINYKNYYTKEDLLKSRAFDTLNQRMDPKDRDTFKKEVSDTYDAYDMWK